MSCWRLGNMNIRTINSNVTPGDSEDGSYRMNEGVFQAMTSLMKSGRWFQEWLLPDAECANQNRAWITIL